MQDDDHLLLFDGEGRVLSGTENGQILFTRAGEIRDKSAVYLFSVDDKKYFLSTGVASFQKAGFSYRPIFDFFALDSSKEVYAVFTAYHLWKWYSDNKFCGKCGNPLVPSKYERALKCRVCGNTVYPRINPAVIVGVIKDDCLLLTKYRSGYGHHALIAGFTEIGETVEETVEREVMEEAGLKVKNIRYYKSQPWGMAQDILMGYYCEVDGDTEIHMDKNELKYAEWVRREDICLQPNKLSLTNEMMQVFKQGGEPK